MRKKEPETTLWSFNTAGAGAATSVAAAAVVDNGGVEILQRVSRALLLPLCSLFNLFRAVSI